MSDRKRKGNAATPCRYLPMVGPRPKPCERRPGRVKQVALMFCKKRGNDPKNTLGRNAGRPVNATFQNCRKGRKVKC
jgi:hypothetical protein